MPNERWICRFFVLSLLLFFSAAGCGSSDSASRLSKPGLGGTAAGFSIDASGGEGTVGDGGYGDQGYGYWGTGIWFDNYGPLGVKIYRTGTADASFTLDNPAATPGFGVEPLTVTTNMTIPVYGADPADNNVYYFLTNNSTLYHKIDDSTINPVTGIRVGPGATLTLGINSDVNAYGGYETAALALDNDIEVLGTLRSAAFDNAATQESGDPNDRGGLAITSSGGVFIRPSGVVSTAGGSATTGRGGHGGTIQISLVSGTAPNHGNLVNEGRIDASGGSTNDPAAEGGGSAVYGGTSYGLDLRTDVRFVSTGTIRADGGTGATGGRAGGPNGNQFYVGGPGTLQNTGTVSLSGGTGTNGDGGTGGPLTLEAGSVSVRNSGAITTRGGNGSVNGGAGGTVYMYVSSSGDLLNSGAVDASGGDSTGTDNSVAANGGQGAEIYLYTYGGRLISSGSVDAGGGDVANGNSASFGGQGGYVDIEDYSGPTPAGAMEISGNIFARGGAGPNGRDGGGVYVYYGDSSGTGGIVLRGYTSLVNNGGRGVNYGGDGGGIYLYDYYSGGVTGSGGLLTEVDISASGGAADVSSGYGGYGGYVEITTNTPPSQLRAVTVDGGAGATQGGAGTIYVDGTLL